MSSEPRDLKLGEVLDAETGELVADDLVVENGDLVLLSGAEAIAQDCAQALRLFRGEEPLDLSAGIPYHTDLFVKNPRLPAVREMFRSALLKRPGVLEVLELRLDFDTATRELEVTWKVSTDEGEVGGATVVP